MDNMTLQRGNNQSLVGFSPGTTIHFRTAEDLQSSAVPSVDCFIATAAFGSPLSPAVSTLREFRDLFLLKHGWGRAFVNLYYTLSPPAAGLAKKYPLIKILILVLLLPWVSLAYICLHLYYVFFIALVYLCLLCALLVLSRVKALI